MISKILVAVDGSENSERALKFATDMARQCNAKVLMITNVMEDFGDAAKVWKKHDPIVKEIEKQHDALLKKYQVIAEKQVSVKVETIRADGNAAKQINKIAENKNADVIVIGSRGLSSAKEFFLGSVSHRVVQHSTKPVLVVK
jgi:nucleotide-binding universal stress UspA family protein